MLVRIFEKGYSLKLLQGQKWHSIKTKTRGSYTGLKREIFI
jgi:hypothetical protein